MKKQMIIKNNTIGYRHNCANADCRGFDQVVMTYYSQINAWSDGWRLNDYNMWICPQCAKEKLLIRQSNDMNNIINR